MVAHVAQIDVARLERRHRAACDAGEDVHHAAIGQPGRAVGDQRRDGGQHDHVVEPAGRKRAMAAW